MTQMFRTGLILLLVLPTSVSFADSSPKGASVAIDGVQAKDPAGDLPANIQWFSSATVDIVGDASRGE